METTDILKQVYSMFTDVWKLYKNHANIEDSDGFWEGLISDSEELAEKYNQSRFVRDLLGAVTADMERRRNNERLQKDAR